MGTKYDLIFSNICNEFQTMIIDDSIKSSIITMMYYWQQMTMLRQPIIDDQYEMNIPQSSSPPIPDHTIHHHPFPSSNYFESPVHYHQNFYDHHQVFQSRPYREPTNIQQTFFDRDRKLMIFPDGNLSFFPHSNHAEMMYDRNRTKAEEEECKWSNNGKQNLKERLMECCFDLARDNNYHEHHVKPSDVQPIEDGGFYQYHGHHGSNNHTVHGPTTPVTTNIKETIKNDDDDEDDDEGTPDCSPNSMDNDIKASNNKIVDSNNSTNNNNISNNSSEEDGKVNNSQPPWNWMRKQSYSTNPASAGKTRTKDKYRIVYTELQKVELEKEFLYNQYITIQRKSELAAFIGLTDRQVKIWFQNRRAKDRKSRRKHEQTPLNDQPCQAQSTSSVFKSYPMEDHFSLLKNQAMDGFGQPNGVRYDYQEVPHSTFFEPCQMDIKDSSTSLQSSLQRHLL